MPKYLTIPETRIPVAAEVDVLVCGGGPAGLAAAVAAARQGADTLIVEQTGCLGGMATSGLVGGFERTVGREGVYTEMMERLRAMGMAAGSPQAVESFEAEYAKYVAMLLAEEAGAKTLLFTFVEDALTGDKGIEGVIVANKSGRQAVRAKVTIDATGDADVAFRAGVECEKGRPDGHLQAVNLMFRVGGLDEKRYAAGAKEFSEEVEELTAQARAAGRIHLPEHIGRVWIGGKGSTVQPGQTSVNIDMLAGVDATDARELTDAMNLCRKQVVELIEFYRSHVPGAEGCYLIDTAALMGVRETRRIVGVSSISAEDVLSARKFSDGICPASFFIDLHDGQLPRLTPEVRKMLWPPEGDWFEIPYGCLVPKEIDGLLVAGRCISTERLANGSIRIMPTCMATGQAAGVAAHLCAAGSVRPRDVDVGLVRATLREKFGVRLSDTPGARPIDARGIRAKLAALFDVPSARQARR